VASENLGYSQRSHHCNQFKLGTCEHVTASPLSRIDCWSLADPVQAVLSHAFSLLWEVPRLSCQRRESCRLRLSTSRSSIFVGLLSAMVTNQVQRACLHVCRPFGMELTALCAVTDPGLFRKRLKTHIFSLAFCVC